MNKKKSMGVLLLAGTAMMAAAVLFLAIPVLRKMQRKKKHRLLDQLSECGSRHNLSFSSQEQLYNRVLALDGVHRKLVLLEPGYRGRHQVQVIDLDDVAACYVTMQYRSMQPRVPSQIGLQFHFNNARPAIEIPFFRTGDNTPQHWRQKEQKARDWSVIISKMLGKPVRGKEMLAVGRS